LGVACAVGAAFFLLRGVFPLAPGSRRFLRGALFAAAIAALLHGAIDVPGHRVGSALMALLVMVLARGDGPTAPNSIWMATLSRTFGLIALGAAIALARMPYQAVAAEGLMKSERFGEAEAAADRALLRAPLDWKMYFTRAGARACEGKTLEALADFRRARTLEPHYTGLALDEGRFWLQCQPMLALNVWSQGLQRLHTPEDEAFYDAMLGAAPDDVNFRAALFTLTRGRPALQLQWFRAVPPAEARAQWETISASADRLTPAQLAAFQKRKDDLGLPATPP
jgi:hypothetical protein